jgi:bacterioferritin-associated ferredoxin
VRRRDGIDIDFHFLNGTLGLAMIVCHCHGVSDRTIRRAVRAGAATQGQVARACGAGAGCGGCVEIVREIVLSELALARTSASAPAAGQHATGL